MLDFRTIIFSFANISNVRRDLREAQGMSPYRRSGLVYI